MSFGKHNISDTDKMIMSLYRGGKKQKGTEHSNINHLDCFYEALRSCNDGNGLTFSRPNDDTRSVYEVSFSSGGDLIFKQYFYIAFQNYVIKSVWENINDKKKRCFRVANDEIYSIEMKETEDFINKSPGDTANENLHYFRNQYSDIGDELSCKEDSIDIYDKAAKCIAAFYMNEAENAAVTYNALP